MMPEASTVPDTLPALLADVVSRRGDHPALVCGEQTVSYRELDRRTALMARGLMIAGVGKGTRIAVLAPDGIFWVTAFLAALRIGALVTPVSTLSTSPELAFLLRHGDIQLLISARRFLGHDYADTLAGALPGFDSAEAGNLHLPDTPYLRGIWMDDAEGLRWARPVDELLEFARNKGSNEHGLTAARLLAAVEKQVVASDPAVVMYTSGSTAQPKAVVHSHWPLACHSPELARHFVLRPEDRMMCLLPLFWMAGMSTMLQVLSVGATQVYPRTPGIDEALATISAAGVTRVNAWGDGQSRLLAAARSQGVDLSRIADFSGFGNGTGKPPLPAMFGMTESFSAHSAEPLDRPLPSSKAGSFGRAINGYQRRVVDPDSGVELAVGELGELQIKGPALMLGLYKRARWEVFTDDGFYPTRDLAFIDADGYLYPAGRLDDMIKTRGANVSRLEVEAALTSLPGVLTAVVAGLADESAGSIVVAAVVPEGNATLDETALRSALRLRLSSYKVPRALVFVGDNDIPRTATGKVKINDIATLIAGRLALRERV